MKYLDEYRDGRLAQSLVKEIQRTATRPWVLMEICGGQTHTLMRYGIDDLVLPHVELVHGPGCPVCVTPVEMIDKALAIAARAGTTLVSYGDMLRVPGSSGNLFEARAWGADVRIAYSPTDAVRIAQQNPERQVVFFGVGFETTAPANAMAVHMAARAGLGNFSMLVSHVLVPPAIRTLLRAPGNRVQAFIAPGHVCTISGVGDYEKLSREFSVPMVVSGFEPLDLLQAILMLVRQLEAGRVEFENQYARSVRGGGNLPAQQIVDQVFEICDRKWRGVGELAASGLRLRAAYAGFDAERVFAMEAPGVAESSECLAAQVLTGRCKPHECPAFATRCTPEHPVGAPMVSSEGACSAYYQYKRHGLEVLR